MATVSSSSTSGGASTFNVSASITVGGDDSSEEDDGESPVAQTQTTSDGISSPSGNNSDDTDSGDGCTCSSNLDFADNDHGNSKNKITYIKETYINTDDDSLTANSVINYTTEGSTSSSGGVSFEEGALTISLTGNMKSKISMTSTSYSLAKDRPDDPDEDPEAVDYESWEDSSYKSESNGDSEFSVTIDSSGIDFTATVSSDSTVDFRHNVKDHVDWGIVEADGSITPMGRERAEVKKNL